jgi:hypothetical protein
LSTLQLCLECLFQSKRATRCLWQRGQTRQDMGDVDWHVPIDVDRRLGSWRRVFSFFFTYGRHDCSWMLQRKNSSVGHCNGSSKAIVEGALRVVRFFLDNPIPISFLRILFFVAAEGALSYVRFFFLSDSYFFKIFFLCRP